MNCRDWEERIALDAEGDLPPREAPEVERHLAGCAECRGFAEGLKQSVAVLRGAHAEPLLPAHFAAVRARVLEQLEPGPGSLWRWAWGGGLAAVAALVMLWMVLRPAAEPPRIAIAPQAPQAEAPPPVAPTPPPRRIVPVRRVKKPRPPAEPLMVKLVTDDPDVVIYWIAD